MESIRAAFSDISFAPKYSGGAVASTTISTFFVSMHALKAFAPFKSPFFHMRVDTISVDTVMKRLGWEKEAQGFTDQQIAQMTEEVLDNHALLTGKMQKWAQKRDLKRVPTLCLKGGDPEGDHYGSNLSGNRTAVAIGLEYLSPTYAKAKGIGRESEKILSAERKFVILRNMAQIKSNNNVKRAAMHSLSYALGPLEFFPGLGLITLIAAFVDLLFHITIGNAISYRMEKKSDLRAVELSGKARRGALTLLEREKDANRAQREKGGKFSRGWNRLWIGKDGNDRINWSKPSFDKRIGYLQESR